MQGVRTWGQGREQKPVSDRYPVLRATSNARIPAGERGICREREQRGRGPVGGEVCERDPVDLGEQIGEIRQKVIAGPLEKVLQRLAGIRLEAE